ncbi:MAG: class I SAM-dependent methyltransferase [Chloroflexi bacterium]|nr:class I SAM-dependent methyltransferase [Chloroflexota bacterium]
MFLKSAHLYDLIYAFKDYAGESEQVRAVIARHATSGGRALLDAGCGSGAHARHLSAHMDITGIDLDAGLIEVARERVPEGKFQVGDMRDFDLGAQFDAVICLFSAIGYVGTVEALNATLACFARHTRQGGVVLVEPWFYPGQLWNNYVTTRHVDQAGALQVVRMSHTTVEGKLSTLDFRYLVGTPEGIEYFTEEHRLTCFSHEEYSAAFEAAGLRVSLETPGLDGRGLYIGVK